MLPLMLGAIQAGMDLDVVGLAWVFNAYAGAVALAVLITAIAGDRLNKTRLFLFGVFLFALGSVLSALASNLTSLVAARLVQGLGGGLFFPLVPVLLTLGRRKGAGRILMIWGGTIGVISAGMPLIGAALLTTFGWASIFLAFALVAVVGAALALFSPPAPENTVAVPVSHALQLLSLRGYWPLLAYIFLTYGCFALYLFVGPVRWYEQGFDPGAVSLLLTCLWSAFAAGSFLLRNHVEGPRLALWLRMAPVFLSIGFAVCALGKMDVALQVASAVFIGLGMACCNSPSTHLLLRIAPPDLRAITSCLDIICARLGGVLIVVLFSLLTPLAMLGVVSALCLLAILLAGVFPYTGEQTPGRDTPAAADV